MKIFIGIALFMIQCGGITCTSPTYQETHLVEEMSDACLFYDDWAKWDGKHSEYPRLEGPERVFHKWKSLGDTRLVVITKAIIERTEMRHTALIEVILHAGVSTDVK